MSAPSGADAGARVAFDIGGTFIDFALRRPDGTLVTEKLLAEPRDLVAGIHSGLASLLQRAGVPGDAVGQLVHATTLGSNAVLERRGPKVALLTTHGFRDVLQIQRSLRYSMYDVQIEKREPLVPRSHVFEVEERRAADGSVLVPLAERQVRELAHSLREQGFESCAVCYLHSYADAGHERRTREILAREAPGLPVTISSDVSLQGREYERANTAVVNAFLAPVIGAYLRELAEALPELGIHAPLWIMQSSGGLAPGERAAELPVRTVESGPAAGALMAAFHGRLAGHGDVLSLDMGGTTAKAAAIRDGRPATSREFELERVEMRRGSGLPLDIPAIDLVEIGMGGGSVAEAPLGVLAVGPRSAGADPGPACYGRGGTLPTVTDANLLLGYLNPDYFAGGALALDVEAAGRAVDGLAAELGLDRVRAAWGIHEVATLEMERAARLVSINRGLDPRDFALVCFGGAAPAHGSRLARALGVRRMVVPPAAGVGSTLGLLEAHESFELARTSIVRLDEPQAARRADAIFRELETEARAVVGTEWRGAALEARRTVGLRFVGQGFEVEVGADRGAADPRSLEESFHRQYERAYGYRETLPVEAVTWFVTLLAHRGEEATPGNGAAPGRGAAARAQKGERSARFTDGPATRAPVLERSRLQVGDRATGPCLVEEAHTTTVVLPGDGLSVDAHGALVIEVERHERS
jgi:N-methylhydantoinase A